MKIVRLNTNFRLVILIILLFIEVPFLHFLSYATLGNRENLVRIFYESPLQIILGRVILCMIIVIPITSVVLLFLNYIFSFKNRILDYIINLIIVVIVIMTILFVKFLKYGYV